MRQMTYDHLCIPAMSAETERVFSDTKTASCNRLGVDNTEAQECVRRWIAAGI